MPISKTRILNGAFQDAEGNPLALGTLQMKLSADEQAPANGQVVSGIEIKVPLDSGGNVSGTVLVWANNDIQPANSFYIVSAFNAAGQLTWGPQYQQVFSPGPFDLNTWIPNNTSINLTNLGVTNLNGETGPITLVAGSGIAVTPSGQNITIASTNSGTVTNTAGALTVHAVVLGNNGNDEKVLGSLGTTTTVLHGNAGGDPSFATVVEADITLANNTTNNVSITKHGFAPIAPNDATKFLDGTGVYSTPAGAGTVTHTGALTASALVVGNGGADEKALASLGTTTTLLHGNAAGLPTFSTVVEGDITLVDVTTNDVSITAHGFAPKAPNDSTKFLNGTGAYSTPSGTAVTLQTNTVNNSSQSTLNLVAGTNVTLTNTSGGNVTIAASGGGGGVLNPLPALGTFTFVNQLTATSKQSIATGPILMVAPDSGAVNWQFLMQTPPTAPYSLAVRLRTILSSGSRLNSATSGLYFRNSTNGKIIGLELLTQTSSSVLRVERITNFNTDNSTVFATSNNEMTLNSYWNWNFGWARLRNDATTLFFDVCYDDQGANWLNLYSEAIATFIALTPNQYGFGGLNVGTGFNENINACQWIANTSAVL